MVSGNPVRLEQLVSNLLRNAIHAASEQAGGRVVRVTTRCDDANIFLIVEDSGKGMSAETIGQLFEPFFTTKNIGEGVGLGLALCFAIVDEAGGRISAENRGEGGARFTISLPPAGAAGRSDRADRKTREAEHA